MPHYSILTVELNHSNHGIERVIRDTVGLFRDVVKFLGPIILTHWEDIRTKNKQEQLSAVEELVHTTKNHHAVYPEFDERFYKFPSYYRRSAINFTLGQVSSYLTRKKEFEEKRYNAISNGKHFREKAPILQLDTVAWPSMYKNQMYFREGETSLCLKVRIRNTWDWIRLNISGRDRKSIEKTLAAGGKLSSPQLILKNKKVYLQFPVVHSIVDFPDTELPEQKVLAVDLGINHGAVCSVVDARGTIHGRFFDPFNRERDSISHLLNKIRKVSYSSGKDQSLAAIYTKLDGVKGNYVRQLAHWIVQNAREQKVYGIVMEYLGPMKGRGRKKDRIHHWCKKRIFDFVNGLALRYGIRVFRVNPRNTSALAFDGSGPVSRNEKNFSLCTFANGKQYHCDLNASYNIGARYFLRAYQKTMLATAWSECMAKVPALSKRTDGTLCVLREFSKLLTPELLSNAA